MKRTYKHHNERRNEATHTSAHWTRADTQVAHDGGEEFGWEGVYNGEASRDTEFAKHGEEGDEEGEGGRDEGGAETAKSSHHHQSCERHATTQAIESEDGDEEPRKLYQAWTTTTTLLTALHHL